MGRNILFLFMEGHRLEVAHSVGHIERIHISRARPSQAEALESRCLQLIGTRCSVHASRPWAHSQPYGHQLISKHPAALHPVWITLITDALILLAGILKNPPSLFCCWCFGFSWSEMIVMFLALKCPRRPQPCLNEWGHRHTCILRMKRETLWSDRQWN